MFLRQCTVCVQFIHWYHAWTSHRAVLLLGWFKLQRKWNAQISKYIRFVTVRYSMFFMFYHAIYVLWGLWGSWFVAYCIRFPNYRNRATWGYLYVPTNNVSWLNFLEHERLQIDLDKVQQVGFRNCSVQIGTVMKFLDTCNVATLLLNRTQFTSR